MSEDCAMGLIDALVDVVAGLIAPNGDVRGDGGPESLGQSGAHADDWSVMRGTAARQFDQRAFCGMCVQRRSLNGDGILQPL